MTEADDSLYYVYTTYTRIPYNYICNHIFVYIYICPTSLNLCGTNLFISVAFFPAKLQEIILRALSHGVRAAKKDTADASAPNFQLKVPRPICLALIDLKDNIWQYELSLIADVNFPWEFSQCH